MSRQAIDYFFDDSDDAVYGQTFVGVFLDPDTYKVKYGNDPSKFDEAMIGLATAKFYDDVPGKQGARDDDIHPEFLNFITRTLGYHDEIDAENAAISQKIWDNVYAKWDQLDEPTKNFYRKYMGVIKGKKGSTIEKIPEDQYPRISLGNGVRLNLKKDVNNGTTLFEMDAIPNFKARVVGKSSNTWGEFIRRGRPATETHGPGYAMDDLLTVMRTDEPQTRTTITGPQYEFGNDRGQGGGRPSPKTRYSPPTAKTFSVNAKKLIAATLHNAKKGLISRSGSMSSLPRSTVPALESLPRNEWSARRQDGETYYKNNTTGIERKDGATDFYDGYDNDKTCYGSFLAKNASACVSAINKCLLTDDKEVIKDCIKSLDKFNEPEVKAEFLNGKVHPQVSLQILKKYGFKLVPYEDIITKVKNYRVMSVDEWLAMCAKHKIIDLTTAARPTDNILRILGYHVQLVNNNPQLINKQSTNTTTPAYNAPAFARALKINENKNGPITNKMSESFRALLQNMRPTRLQNIVPSFGVMNNPFSPSPLASAMGINPFGVMVGGAMPVGQHGGSYITQDGGNFNDQPLVGARVLRNFFESIKGQLQYKNKTFGDADLKQIESELADIEKLETKLVEIILYMSEYNKLVSAFGDKSKETVNIDKMKNYYEYFNKNQFNYYTFMKKIIVRFVDMFKENEYTDIEL